MTMYEQGVSGGQFESVYLRQVLKAMGELDLNQMDSIILLARGHQYDAAADIIGVADGTVKSRVARGRAVLRKAVE